MILKEVTRPNERQIEPRRKRKREREIERERESSLKGIRLKVCLAITTDLLEVYISNVVAKFFVVIMCQSCHRY